MLLDMSNNISHGLVMATARPSVFCFAGLAVEAV
jgi:hypothetical protein